MSRELRRALLRFGLAMVVVTGAFVSVLAALGRMALDSDLFSYILLIPAIVAGLVWWRADAVLTAPVRPAWGGAGLFAVAGGAMLAVRMGSLQDSPLLDQLAASMLAFVCFIVAAAFACFGSTLLRRVAGPAALLVFLVPFPPALEARLENFLQHGSAMMAEPMFTLWGTPLMRDELVFRLPGITLQIAPECSGIHSTVVLLITSLVASLLVLEHRWSRLVLIAAIIPLALVRNGLRVFVIGQLSVDYGPQMMDSWVHRHGGPLFFTLSMIPLLAILAALVWSERRRAGIAKTASV